MTIHRASGHTILHTMKDHGTCLFPFLFLGKLTDFLDRGTIDLRENTRFLGLLGTIQLLGLLCFGMNGLLGSVRYGRGKTI